MSVADVRRAIVALPDGYRAGLRRAGAGPAVLVCGPAGGGSVAVTEHVAAVGARGLAAVAPDPPGLGLSDPAGSEPLGLTRRAAHAVATLDALGAGRVAVLSIGDGAALALAVAGVAGDRVTAVALAAADLPEGEVRARRLAALDPGPPPALHGGHLTAAWIGRRLESVYGRDGRRIDVDLTGPDAVRAIHRDVVIRLDALGDWTDGRRAALEVDGATLRDCAGAPIAELADADPAGVVAAIDPAGADPLPEAAPPGRALSADGALARGLADTPAGQLLVRRGGHPGRRRPLVLLHASPISGESLVGVADALGVDREVVVLDTLGNGDSDAPNPTVAPAFADPSIADYAAVAWAAVDDLDLDAVDVYGTHTGALIALEMGIARPARVGRAVLDGVTLLDPTLTTEIFARYFVDLEPRWDGTHLVTAWSTALDRKLWFPWFARRRADRYGDAPPSADELHRYVVQFLKSGTTYPLSYRAAFRYPTAERLALLSVPAALCRRGGDMLAPQANRAAALAPRGELVEVSGTDPVAAVAALRDFLDAEE